MPAIEEQRPALLGVAEGGVAALVHQVVGLGLDDARGQPASVDAVADDLAQQLPGNLLGVAVEEFVRQRAGAGPGQT
ncbi:hypothetical protein D3C81_1796120 [compost metagenome]